MLNDFFWLEFVKEHCSHIAIALFTVKYGSDLLLIILWNLPFSDTNKNMYIIYHLPISAKKNSVSSPWEVKTSVCKFKTMENLNYHRNTEALNSFPKEVMLEKG